MATTSRKRSPGIRLTAAERRDAIVEAAVHEFALGGFDGTSAAVIALRAAFLSLPQKRTLLLLAEQALVIVAAAMDLPEAWS